MDKKMNYNLEYEKVVGEKVNFEEYLGPEEQGQRITPCNILEVTEIGYGNGINIDL